MFALVLEVDNPAVGLGEGDMTELDLTVCCSLVEDLAEACESAQSNHSLLVDQSWENSCIAAGCSLVLAVADPDDSCGYNWEAVVVVGSYLSPRKSNTRPAYYCIEIAAAAAVVVVVAAVVVVVAAVRKHYRRIVAGGVQHP